MFSTHSPKLPRENHLIRDWVNPPVFLFAQASIYGCISYPNFFLTQKVASYRSSLNFVFLSSAFFQPVGQVKPVACNLQIIFTFSRVVERKREKYVTEIICALHAWSIYYRSFADKLSYLWLSIMCLVSAMLECIFVVHSFLLVSMIHCLDILHCVYLFISWWTFVLFTLRDDYE